MPQDISVDLNMAGSDNNTPLHVACSVGNDNVVQYLFKKDVDPNIKGQNDWVALEWACWLGHPRIVGLLLSNKKINVNYNHPQRGSCLHLAAKADHFQICQMLLMHQIDLTVTNQDGKRAKDVTQNPKIIKLIERIESSGAAGINEDKLEMPREVIDEEKSDEEDNLNSSFTASPPND